jgi:hypothetical protein
MARKRKIAELHDPCHDINERIVILRQILEDYKAIERNLIELQKALRAAGDVSILCHDSDIYVGNIFFFCAGYDHYDAFSQVIISL